MAQIFRVERTKNFTVMSNHHFKNKNLTLKAKGLLSLMLSLPDDWNYNMQVIAWSKDKYKSDVCFYGHTGGTTGFPKSVILTNRSFNSVAWQYISTFPHDKGEVFLNLIPPFVTYGAMINMHMPLCLGLELVLIPKFDPDEWHTYFRKYGQSILLRFRHTLLQCLIITN